MQFKKSVYTDVEILLHTTITSDPLFLYHNMCEVNVYCNLMCKGKVLRKYKTFI